MNKLVIVGNGFDLAHNLPTSYKHFIDDFWVSLSQNWEDELIKNIIEVDSSNNWRYFLDGNFSNFEEFQKSFEMHLDHPMFPIQYDSENHTAYRKGSPKTVAFRFKNDFFKEVNVKAIENWVDIENEYFIQLKKISKRKISSYIGSREKADKKQEQKNIENVNKLNKEFKEVKKLLKLYLTKSTQDSYKFFNSRISDFQKLLRFLEVKPLHLSKSNQNRNFLNEFSLVDHNSLIEFDTKLVEAQQSSQINEFLANSNKKTVFLNFNYTDSVYPYVEIMKTQNYGYYLPPEEIPIHGRLKNTLDYEMIFGFGDEMDEDYKFIENLNQNEYLSNFKSFKYARTPYYKKLLDYIDSEKFQVFVMGHSCGLSDRTMLNTIFEHNNCRSIKVFFYEWENHNGERMDNFSEIVQNISRHFNNKKLMREKLVNKSLCHPFPQNMRFEKKGV